MPEGGIDRRIEDQEKTPEEDLVPLGEPIRVEEWHHVAVDELTPVTLLTAHDAELVLQRRERADPAGELDEYRPAEGRQVQPGEVPPPEDEKAAQDGEQDESAMDYNHQISRETIHHGYLLP